MNENDPVRFEVSYGRHSRQRRT